MKTLLLLLLLLSGVSCYGQVTSSSPKPDLESKVLEVMDDSGKYFKIGLSLLANNQKQLAKKEFDKSIEVFLISDISIKDNATLNNCHKNLIETIYRLEFAKKSDPQFLLLSQSCNWKLDEKIISESSFNKSNPESTYGFTEQAFEASPLDELSKLVLRQESNTNPVYTRQSISNTLQSYVMVVKAQHGDTVEIIAKRYGAKPIEVAKFNGLFVDSKLNAGREIRIPFRDSIEGKSIRAKLSQVKNEKVVAVEKNSIGAKPSQAKDGKVAAVMKYYNEYFNDPYSMRFVRWSSVVQKLYKNNPYWAVQVKFRAKNSFGAYILIEEIYFIRNNKVVAVQKL